MKKKSSKLNAFHTSNSKKPLGDSYGSGIKNPMGRILDKTGKSPIAPHKIKPPKPQLA